METKTSVMVVVAMVVMAVGMADAKGLAPPLPSTIPKGCNVHPPNPPSSFCKEFCDISGEFGQYYCCDSKGNRSGQCPSTYMSDSEIRHLCDKTQPHYPFHLDCTTDADCEPGRKCCYAPGNHQLLCRRAV